MGIRPRQHTPLGARLALQLLLHLALELHSGAVALPTIQQQQPQNGGNYVQQLDKSFFQPPEVEQTIDEVQKILANDPALPRLTRGEIEELYEKVTRAEYEKSIEAGDMSRADSMRALMLVLPYNTDNNTEENLQELYTRPPVTRVIDAYTPPEPIKFLTPDPNAMPRSTVPGGNPAVAATTYKPAYNVRQHAEQLRPMPTATTYHPPAPVMYQMAPSLGLNAGFQPITKPPYIYDYAKLAAPAAALPVAVPPQPQRFSSHYSAKNAEFLRKPKPSGSVGVGPAPLLPSSTTTVKPVADILESLGIVSGSQTHKRYAIDDYYPAESAPQPVVASVADLRGLQGARIKPDAYTNFKPLNIGEELRVKPEVEGYLTRFGIVKKSSKALKKNQLLGSTEEPASAQTELATVTAKVPPQTNAELAKLLENLQELERLQARRKPSPTTTTSTTTTTTTSSTTTSTTTPAPATAAPTAQLITHGAPMLIEPKKPRRRIDPNIDINFANAGNQQTPAKNQADELSKLLENLQELEKLQINPENVLKAQTLSNRFSETTTTSTRAPNDARELQLILKQLQQMEQANAARKAAAATSTTTTTTTTTTTRKPQNFGLGGLNGLGANDLLQLQRLLSDDRELERLYEQARNNKKLAKSSTTTTTTSTTSTTRRPTKPTSTPVDNAQFEALITRVQQLERLNLATPAPTLPTADVSANLLGFTTRNVLSPLQSAALQGLPINDFAQLQQLAVTSRQPVNVKGVEISTAATALKQRQRTSATKLSNFELSNETGLLQDVEPQDYVQLQKLLSKVQELERVQLPQVSGTAAPQLVTAASIRTQHVKNLNGAQIVYAQQAPPSVADGGDLKLELPVYEQPKQTPPVRDLSSSEELRELAMSQPANPQRDILPADKEFEQYQQFFSSLEDNAERQSYQNMQPIYKTATTTAVPPFALPSSTPAAPRFVAAKRPVNKPTPQQTQQANLEELQKLLYNTQELKKLGVALPNELSQQLESKLQASSTTPRTTTSTVSTTTMSTTSTASSSSTASTSASTASSSQSPSPSSSSSPSVSHDSSSPAVFSLTTLRPLTPREPRPTTESNLELPVFSATKIIEAAIKRAANRIGVSTEHSIGSGFRRRSDDEDQLTGANGEDAQNPQLGVLDGDLMAEFSELNYQLALPPADTAIEASTPEPRQAKSADIGDNLDELQRLISNLQELQKLNVSLGQSQEQMQQQQQQQADKAYLDGLKAQQLDSNDTFKSRRQSDSTTTSTTTTTTESLDTATLTTTQAPTRISLSLGLSDADMAGEADKVNSQSSTTEASSSDSSTTTTTEESRNGSLDDLADSFGPDPISEEPPPAKKKNGFYFLADWNSFLEVGDGDDQVVVRLSPKIGDPRLFLPVKIP